ncbi:unnamed protein product [Adineta steineri]|uniref:VCBS repeat-containing protein n=1 Tax=Adineta steineri TaxID=433720 RepID=A0A815Z4L3_9BILA|nr:unnamed protein product [Adineta steineri]CAF1578679.1 unnamed protein product [Adineta steineri]
MQEPPIPEDHSQKETILSTKCQFLLWSWVLILISIMISVIATDIPCNPIEFSNYTSYPTQSYPWSISNGYFDEDSFLDIIVVNRGNTSIGIYYGFGNGTFESPKLYNTAYDVAYVFVRDMNNDNKSDIVLTYTDTNQIAIFINKGNQNFNSPITFPVGNYPYWIDVSDFNKNNLLDVIVVNDRAASVTILYDYNYSNLSFSFSKTYPCGNDVTGVSVADFNNDSYPDFVTTDYSDNTISLYINPKNGIFNHKKKIYTSIAPWGIATADLNNDNFIDIVNTNFVSFTISVFSNDGHGNFNKFDTYYIGGTTMSVTLADLNNDTFIDIIAANRADNFICIFLNKQNGIFETCQRFITEWNIYGDTDVDFNVSAVTTGDFNGDNKIDIALCTGQYNMNVLLNLC